MFRAGDQIGPYTLISKLGRGAFGIVWLADRQSPIASTKVALKMPLDDDEDLEAIRQEATLWIQAGGHPNVLPLIEANIYDSQIVIVSEYAPDGSLESWLNQRGGVAPTIAEAVDMASGILAGLEHLHARHIIHRDLKPANILLQGSMPRLVDFGLSRVLKSTSQSSIVAGTPGYMAPEAFEGKRNEQTDIWSVGVILYRMLAGCLPFSAADLPALMGAILTKDPEPLPPQVPTPLLEIVTRALNKQAGQRYQSATEMRRALRNALESSSRESARRPAPVSDPDQSTRLIDAPHLIPGFSPTPTSREPALPQVNDLQTSELPQIPTGIASPSPTHPSLAQAPGNITSPVAQTAPEVTKQPGKSLRAWGLKAWGSVAIIVFLVSLAVYYYVAHKPSETGKGNPPIEVGNAAVTEASPPPPDPSPKNKDEGTDKANRLIEVGNAAILEGNTLLQDASAKESRVFKVFEALGAAKSPADLQALKSMAQAAIDSYAKSATKYREAAAVFDEASKLKIHEMLKAYLTLKSQAFTKRAELADAEKSDCQAVIDTDDFAALRAQISDNKERTRQLTKEANALTQKANIISQRNKGLFQPDAK